MAVPGNPGLTPACAARGSPSPKTAPRRGRPALVIAMRARSGSGVGPRRSRLAIQGEYPRRPSARGRRPRPAPPGRAPVRKRESSPDHAEAQIGAARPALRWGNGLGRTPIRPEPGISCSDTAHSSKFDPRGSAKKRTTGIACSEQAAWRLGAGLKKASGGGR
jgi:hypothetical protein